jgi:hypothetical protein
MREVPFGKFGFIKKESVDWMRGHLLLMGGSVIAVALATMAVVHGFKGDSRGDFLAAEMAYLRWEGNSFTQLQRLLKKHPELHAKYDGGIAQKLLSSSESGLAASYGKSALRRMKDVSFYHTQFSEGSLLMANEQFSEALAKAKELKTLMEQDDAFWEQKSQIVRHGSILFAYNLLRIALLEKVAGTPAHEWAAWQDLKKHAGWGEDKQASKAYDPEAFRLLQENFQSEEISLTDYIRYREVLLTSKSNS